MVARRETVERGRAGGTDANEVDQIHTFTINRGCLMG